MTTEMVPYIHPMSNKPNEVVTRATALKSFWRKRDIKFKEWYKLLQMVDELKQDNMESFVGNDPRAAYNLVLHILDQNIPHRIRHEQLEREMSDKGAEVEHFFSKVWRDNSNRHRLGGSAGLMRDIIGFIISTGWYSVFSMIEGERVIIQPWNPATVYSSWGDGYMSECAHIFPLQKGELEKLYNRNHWINPPGKRCEVFDYWWVEKWPDGFGAVHNTVFNSVVIDRKMVKVPTPQPQFMGRIPIFTGPVGGLPDMGPLQANPGLETWKGERGQPPLVTNENIYRSWNKWWTFSMQLLRDTAQPRIIEKKRSGQNIVRPEDVFKRGAIFRMGPEDDVGYMVPPPMPTELRSVQLDMEAMMQRGGPSWAMYGAVQQKMTAFMMSHIVAAVSQMIKPFHQAVEGVVSDIDNFTWKQMKELGMRPYGFTIPAGLPTDAEITAQYPIRIPGDMASRATTARMLNGNFQVSEARVMKDLFPEITDPIREQSIIRAEQALRDPTMALLTLIGSLRQQAQEMADGGDDEAARLYSKAADAAEARIDAPERTGPPQGQPQLPPGGRAMLGGA